MLTSIIHRGNLSSQVVLGNDLCGIFIRNNQKKFGQNRQTPISNTNKIKEFLKKVSNVKGVKQSLKTIQYVLNNSNSPMESKLAAVSQLPLMQGGFHLLKPELNYLVKLSNQGRKLVKNDYLCCDFVWPEKKLIVEYDSNLTHLEKRQHYYDKQRTTALNLSGYSTLYITAENLSNFRSIEEVFYLIRSKLEMRPLSSEFEKTLDKRYETVKQIFFSGKII